MSRIHIFTFLTTFLPYRKANATYTAVTSGIKFLDGEMDDCSRAANGSDEFQSNVVFKL